MSRNVIVWTAKRKTTAVLMIALLAVTLSTCESTVAGNTTGGSAYAINDTAISGWRSPEIQKSIADTEAADEEVLNTELFDNGDVNLDENGMINISITVSNQVFDAKFYNNESVQVIVSEMPFTLKMDDYASQEKVTDLTFALPSVSAETPATINAGDIYLWSGNSLVLFYTTFSNSYSYIPLGYFVDVAGLTDALGKESVTVSFHAAE